MDSTTTICLCAAPIRLLFSSVGKPPKWVYVLGKTTSYTVGAESVVAAKSTVSAFLSKHLKNIFPDFFHIRETL
jgi:hypothetical protein